jgi:hypothetical protein
MKEARRKPGFFFFDSTCTRRFFARDAHERGVHVLVHSPHSN